MRRTLLTVELGMTVVLLIGAGLLLKSYQRLRDTDMGMRYPQCINHDARPLGRSLQRTGASRQLLWTRCSHASGSLPGVTEAGIRSRGARSGIHGRLGIHHSRASASATGHDGSFYKPLGPIRGYFKAMSIPILRGPHLRSQSTACSGNQAVVSASFARQYLPNEDPIGKHIQVDDRKYEIVGIVGDTRYSAAKAGRTDPVFSALRRFL